MMLFVLVWIVKFMLALEVSFVNSVSSGHILMIMMQRVCCVVFCDVDVVSVNVP